MIGKIVRAAGKFLSTLLAGRSLRNGNDAAVAVACDVPLQHTGKEPKSHPDSSPHRTMSQHRIMELVRIRDRHFVRP
jgi:hypothetical protein